MAQIIGDLSRGRGRPAKYPWGAWTDGQSWRARRGIDFEGSPRSFCSTIRSHAVRNDLRVLTSRPDTETVEFRFLREAA